MSLFPFTFLEEPKIRVHRRHIKSSVLANNDVTIGMAWSYNNGFTTVRWRMETIVKFVVNGLVVDME